MADIIPDRLPKRASKGEEHTYNFLKKLPDDYLVYYEPNINNRRPDFVVIAPDLGVLVIEVKGWRVNDILQASDSKVTVLDDGLEIDKKHPLLQAREYQWRLVDLARKHPRYADLLQKEGPHKNHFIFPFGHFVILSNISKDSILNYRKQDLSVVFPLKNTMTRDTLLTLADATGDEIRVALQGYFDPIWRFPPLTSDQVDVLKGVIHPEIILSYLSSNSGENASIEKSQEVKSESSAPQSLKVLDKRQENNVKKIGEGHRIIYGVAGSGKTVILLARARWLCESDPDLKILLLCYNVVLATYLKNQMSEYPQIEVYHFDEWARKNRIFRVRKDPSVGGWEEDEPFGERLLAKLETGKGDYRKFDAILIDEAQDFSPSWFRCMIEALKEPLDGDLLIVCDGNQGIRPIHSISWKSLGIKASGRTLHHKLDLDRNYRNTYEILKLASNFVSDDISKDEDSFSIVPVNPETAVRHGPKPVLIHCTDHKDECKTIIQFSKMLLKDFRCNGNEISPLDANEIGVLYGGRGRNDHHLFEEFLFNFNRISPVIWLNLDPAARKKIVEPGIKIQTVHSAKGLQYRATFLMWADTFTPYNFKDEILKRRLLYVALTRSEEFLVITYSKTNEYIDRMISSGCVTHIESESLKQGISTFPS